MSDFIDSRSRNNRGGMSMKGYIGSREKCGICKGRLVHDPKRNGCFCQVHPEIGARTFYVKFGRQIYKRFGSNCDRAARFLNGLRFKEDEGSFDVRDYKATNPLGFENLADQYLDYRASLNDIKPKTLQTDRNFLGRAIANWGNRNIKDITDGDIDDLVLDPNWSNRNGAPASDKTRSNMVSVLHSFWEWVIRRERRNGKSNIRMPEFPKIKYELQYRKIVDYETLLSILDEIKEISFTTNPKIWLGIKLLSRNINVRPGELISIKEKDIDLSTKTIHIRHPKEKTRNKGKFLKLGDDDVKLFKSLPRGLPEMHYFRHQTGKKGVVGNSPFGPKYLKTWWDRACKNLGITGVGLYAGTKHTVAKALSSQLTPEQIRRGGTGHANNKAFERYLIPDNDDRIVVQNTLSNLEDTIRGKVINLKRRHNEK